ncbi:hypothetical protein EZS27_007361 [termite gut metagenome]|uniref:Uncharacterized protein n=1 Tax=termite gut metagenome TaxID=433724 RepID=A0A5J4SIH3_9ZZZZ
MQNKLFFVVFYINNTDRQIVTLDECITFVRSKLKHDSGGL